MIDRPRLLQSIERSLSEAPVVVLLGARQTGKTTLARLTVQQQQAGQEIHYFDLERAPDRAALSAPETTLAELKGLIVIDEVQRLPELFRVIRPLVDRIPLPAHFLLLGSASPGLVRGVSESLAGRALFVQVPGFGLDEIGAQGQQRLWLRGGFPRSYLAVSEAASLRWRESFIATFLERDLPQLGIRVPAETLRRFWVMTAHYHAQRWNGSEIARSLGVTEKTTRHYLDILSGAFVVRVLAPWYANVAKRQVKAPKVYIRDSGILHSLLGIDSLADLRAHPKYGASWEGLALEQMLTLTGERNAFFWATQSGAELDLLLVRHGRHYGFEFKCVDAPVMSRSLHVALADLQLHRAFVIYPGSRRYPIHELVEAVPISLLNDVAGGLS